jgi:hypothetical protein
VGGGGGGAATRRRGGGAARRTQRRPGRPPPTWRRISGTKHRQIGSGRTSGTRILHYYEAYTPCLLCAAAAHRAREASLSLLRRRKKGGRRLVVRESHCGRYLPTPRTFTVSTAVSAATPAYNTHQLDHSDHHTTSLGQKLVVAACGWWFGTTWWCGG